MNNLHEPLTEEAKKHLEEECGKYKDKMKALICDVLFV